MPDAPIPMIEVSRVRSVRTMKVIEIQSIVGEGKEDSPIRPFFEYFDMDGRKLEFGDITRFGKQP